MSEKPTMTNVGPPYIAVVAQPACANVFLVPEWGKRERLVQGTREYCAAFAGGYALAENRTRGYFNYVRKFECAAGDAARLSWWPEDEGE